MNRGGGIGTARGRSAKPCAVLVVLLAAGLLAAGRPALGEPGETVKLRKRTKEQRSQQAIEYLTKLYGEHIGSSDWIARAAGTISMSRMPTDSATKTILERIEKETHPVAQAVAWQALLGRAGRLDAKQYEAWLAATRSMIAKDVFHGDLRIGLLEMLSAHPITREDRDFFKGLFLKANSLDSSDIPTLIAMGRALGKWRDAELIEGLIRALGSPSTAVRAELVLQAAGVDVQWCRAPAARRVYGKWWEENQEEFTKASIPEQAWRKLKPQFIGPPMAMSEFDIMDPRWRNEMELGRLKLSRFDFAIAIDCSRSMRAEIDRLKRDMRIMFAAFSQIAREVGVGVTLFAPGQIVKHLPLTGSLSRIMAYVNAADIMGPAGEEEWAGALQVTMKGSRWAAAGKYTKRAIVLMSDEPITDAQYHRAIKLAKDGAKEGFRIYGIMIKSDNYPASNPLSVPFDRTSGESLFAADKDGAARDGGGNRGGGGGGGRSWEYYDELAKATGGRAITVMVPQGGLGLGAPISSINRARQARANKGGGKGGKGGKRKKKSKPPPKPISEVSIAPIYAGGGPTGRILTMVLTDAINPRHADRIEPFVKILVAYCQKAAPHQAERRRWGVPDEMEPNRK